MNRKNDVETAKSYATKGFLCSESVLLAISQWIEIRNELIPRIATGFRASIGGQGMICRASAGGMMALGLEFGRNDIKKQDIKPYWFAFEFLRRFRREYGRGTCGELDGCDFNIESGRKNMLRKDMGNNVQAIRRNCFRHSI